MIKYDFNHRGELGAEQRAAIVRVLAKVSGIREAVRTTVAAKNTVVKLLRDL